MQSKTPITPYTKPLRSNMGCQPFASRSIWKDLFPGLIEDTAPKEHWICKRGPSSRCFAPLKALLSDARSVKGYLKLVISYDKIKGNFW